MATTTTGVVRQVDPDRLGSQLVADAPSGTSVLTLDTAAPFSPTGGNLRLDDVTAAYVSADAEAGTITLADPLGATLETGLPVWQMAGNEIDVTYWATVDLDDPDARPISARVPTSIRGWLSPERDYTTPVPVTLRLDAGTWEVVDPNQAATFDGSFIDPDTLPTAPPAPTSDGLPPAAAPVLTFIGGIGSLFFRWTEVANADPVTYRLHVRVGSAPTTDGTYEVAAGVGLTTAAVRKLRDGATVVGDGTVTYYGVVTVEDADGAGPASNTASGVPAQINSPDIAANAVSADMLIANDALIDALSVVDLSTVNLDAVNIDGGSIAIAVSPSGSYPQAFSGAALPAGWTSTKTGTDGTGTGSANIPGASVVSTGAPVGAVGSTLLIDYGPAGQVNAAAGYVKTAVPNSSDVEATVRFRHSAQADPIFARPNLWLAVRRQDGAANTGTEDAILLDLSYRDAFSLDQRNNLLISRLNGTNSTLANVYYHTDTTTAWHIAKLRIVAGQLQAKIWREGDAEPAWTTVQQAGVITPGEIGLLWSQATGTGSATGTGQKSWVDSFDVTTYSTGFTVNPDGTGSWPVLESRVTAAAMQAGDVRQVAQDALAQATSATNVTLPGLAFTVDSPGPTAAWTVSIGADVDIRIASTNIVELVADGVAQGPQLITTGPAGTRGAGFKEWYVTGLAAGSRTFTARTRNTAASTDARINAGHTLMTIKRVL